MACSGSTVYNLPPGLTFCPTDAEIVLHFLYPKVMLLPYCPDFIPDLDLSLQDPWELHGQAFANDTNQYYCFSKANDCRIGKSGYWKELDIVQPIFSTAKKKVGFKKYLVFNMGKASESAETTWLMQEYHLCASDQLDLDSSITVYRSNGGTVKLNSKIEWVLCRVCERDEDSGPAEFCCMSEDDSGSELSLLDEVFLQLLDIDDDPHKGISWSF